MGARVPMGLVVTTQKPPSYTPLLSMWNASRKVLTVKAHLGKEDKKLRSLNGMEDSPMEGHKKAGKAPGQVTVNQQKTDAMSGLIFE